MRKLLLSLLMVFGFAIVASAQTQDVVYLNNGSIIKGKIVEKTPTGTVKIETMCGSVFAYNQQEIQSLATEKMTSIYGRKIVDLPKHIFGIRAGAMFSRVGLGGFLDDFSKKYLLPGFHVGGTYELSITKTNRWYLQTGLDFQFLRGKYISYDDLYETDDIYASELEYDKLVKSQAMYIEVPVMFTCKCDLGKGVLLCPSIGASYSVGLTGKYSYDAPFDEEYETGNPFNEVGDNNPLFGRHCFSLKVGLSVVVKQHYFIGCGAFVSPLFGDHLGFSATIGYNF